MENSSTTMAMGKKKKMVEPWNWEGSADNIEQASQAAHAAVEQDTRDQPWQRLLRDLERESSASPIGTDYFPCQDGFHAHSLAA